MVFPSLEFAFFFPVVLVLSWVLMPWPRVWKPFFLVASYVFYGAASAGWAVLLAAVTLANQLGAVLIARARTPRAQTWVMTGIVAVDLLVLGLFKYYGFFAEEIGRSLDAVGLGMPLPLLELALPIGLSFITFQAISYVVDVRRGHLAPASTIDFALYLAFFPHVVAGPIVRAREFIPQLAVPRDPRRVAVGAGVVLIALGLVKKVAIADFLARNVVDDVFAVPQAYSAPDVALAAYAYAAQIYCDFSGYTDIAIGLALLLGFVFPQNFNSPYRALSFSDFWRRWHMTLSRFLRDFLYIPLGGNRKGKWKTYRNLFLTMLLGGLWHGAAWTFVLWGAFQGAGLTLEHIFSDKWERVWKWLRWVITFHLIVFGWILFRSQSLSQAGSFIKQLFVPGAATLWSPAVIAGVVVVIGLQLLPDKRVENFQFRIERLRPVVIAGGLAILILFVGATVPSQGVAPFIYFRF